MGEHGGRPPYPIWGIIKKNICLLISCYFYTRMVGRRDLSILHTPLQIGLFAGKCSPVLCVSTPMLLWRKNTRLLEPSGLSFRTRRRRPVCQEAYALPCCAFRARRWKLSCKRMNGFLYSPARAFHFLSVIIKGVWGGAPWLRAALALFTTSFLSCKGVWGPAPPCFRMAFDLPLPPIPAKKDRAKALSFFFKNPEPSECSPASGSPCARRAGWRLGCRE